MPDPQPPAPTQDTDDAGTGGFGGGRRSAPPPPPSPPPTPQVTYAAKSVLLSGTLWFNVITLLISVLGMTEFQQAIAPVLSPQQLALLTGTVIPIGNMVLRIFKTVRPVALIPPSQVQMVSVNKI